jgi:hypothetical protein
MKELTRIFKGDGTRFENWFVVIFVLLFFVVYAHAADYAGDKKVDELADVSGADTTSTRIPAQDMNDTDKLGYTTIGSILGLVDMEDISDVTGEGTAATYALFDDNDGTYSFRAIATGDVPDLSGTYEVQLTNEAGLYSVLADVSDFVQTSEINTAAKLESVANLGAYANELLDDADAAAMRATLGIDTAANLETSLSLGAFASDLLGYANGAAVLAGIGAEGDLSNEAGLYAALSDVDNFLQTGDTINDDDVDFDDADSNWTATTIGAALEELDNVINGGAPNDATGKVDWSQLVNVPAGFADGADASGSGGVNEAYSSGWDADTDAPEKDDVYDYLHQIDSDDDGSLTDETWFDLDNIAGTDEAGLYGLLSDVADFVQPAEVDVEMLSDVTGEGTAATYALMDDNDGTYSFRALTAGDVPAITVSDDESTDDDHEIVFTTNNQNLESDGDLTYNPSTGTLKTTTIETAATTSPGVTGNDSDCPGTDKEIGSINWQYLSGGDGAEDGNFTARAYLGGSKIIVIEWNSDEETLTLGDSANGEDLIIDFETATDNEASLSSNSGLTQLNFSALNMVTSGTIAGRIPQGADITGNTNHDTTELHGRMYKATAAATVTLDAAADAGFGACAAYRVRDAAEALTLDPQAGEKMNLEGTALAAGTAVVCTGAGEFISICATTDTDGIGTDGYDVWGHTSGCVSE